VSSCNVYNYCTNSSINNFKTLVEVKDEDGDGYNNLVDFPGALFDPNGYVLFKTEKDYLGCAYLKIGKETNVPKGIWSMPGYVKVR